MFKCKKIKNDIQLLENFVSLLDDYFNETNDEKLKSIKSELSRNLSSVKSISKKAGTYQVIGISGGIMRAGNLCPFDNLFMEIPFSSIIPQTKQIVESTIGLYKSGEIKDIWKNQNKTKSPNNKSVVSNIWVITIVCGLLVSAVTVFLFQPWQDSIQDTTQHKIQQTPLKTSQ